MSKALPRYRVLPALFSRYRLERRVWFWWNTETFSDDYNELAERVRQCGGVLVNPPALETP